MSRADSMTSFFIVNSEADPHASSRWPSDVRLNGSTRWADRANPHLIVTAPLPAAAPALKCGPAAAALEHDAVARRQQHAQLNSPCQRRASPCPSPGSSLWCRPLYQHHHCALICKVCRREPASVPQHGVFAPASRSSMSSIPADILIRSSGSPLAARTCDIADMCT